MACNIFPHTATDESPFFLMHGWDAYLPMLHNLLQPKICYMGDDECKTHLETMREVYMLVVLNLKMSHDRYPPPMGNPHNDELKIGDLVLIKNQTPQSLFNAKYKPSYKIFERLVSSHMMYKTPLVKLKESLQGIYKFCTCRILCDSTTPSGNVQENCKFINHPSLMPDLYKELDNDRHTAVDKQTGVN